MNDDALFAPLSNYREGASKLTGISNKMISRIKGDSENADPMKRQDGAFATLTSVKYVYIVKSYTTNKITNYYNKTISLILGFEPLSLH